MSVCVCVLHSHGGSIQTLYLHNISLSKYPITVKVLHAQSHLSRRAEE